MEKYNQKQAPHITTQKSELLVRRSIETHAIPAPAIPAGTVAVMQQEARQLVNDAVALKGKAKKQVPYWLVFLLVSVFGMVMALPLLQL